MLRETLRGVDVVETGANLGFSAGSNAGIRCALAGAADLVLLVNSDAVLAPDALGRLLEAAAADPAGGVFAPVLVSREEPDHIASAGISFSTRSGRMRHRGAGLPVSLLPAAAVVGVTAVSGCVMLVRRSVFERVGLLDEDYFFSFEDIEFCLRAHAAGFGISCVQGATAYHEGGRSIGRRSARRVYFATRNHLRLAEKAGVRSGRRLRAVGIVGLNVVYVLTAPEAPLVGGLAAVARGTWHHLTGRYGPG
jgi:GT2 family glycosyltransferase